MTELAIPEQRDRVLRAPIGLLVATGALVPTRDGKSERPTQLGWFRFKPGQLDQYADAVQRALEVYGDEPTSLDDVYLLSNDIRDVLDIRIKAWAKSGLRIIGDTNFAELHPDEYAARVDGWQGEQVTFRPREAKDVPPKMRDNWNGEPIPLRAIEGPDDPLIGKYEMRVEATFRFCLPRVFGMGPIALYSTTSKHNRDQLYKALTDAFGWLQGNLVGIPFRFRIRPRRTSYFDREKRAYMPTQTFEVVFDTPWTYAEAIDAVREQRLTLGRSAPLALPAGPDSDMFDGTSSRDLSEREAAVLAAGRDLPHQTDEDTLVREEPSALNRVDEAQLNRLAVIAQSLEDEGLRTYLVGAFGVETLEELTPAQADQAELGLSRLAGVDIEEGEIVEAEVQVEGEVGEQVSFADMVPDEVKKQTRGRKS